MASADQLDAKITFRQNKITQITFYKNCNTRPRPPPKKMTRPVIGLTILCTYDGLRAETLLQYSKSAEKSHESLSQFLHTIV